MIAVMHSFMNSSIGSKHFQINFIITNRFLLHPEGWLPCFSKLFYLEPFGPSPCMVLILSIHIYLLSIQFLVILYLSSLPLYDPQVLFVHYLFWSCVQNTPPSSSLLLVLHTSLSSAYSVFLYLFSCLSIIFWSTFYIPTFRMHAISL